MTLDLEEVNTGSTEDSGPTAYQRRMGKGKTPERSRRPAGGHPHDSDPFFTASDKDGRGRRHRRGVAGGGGGDAPVEPQGESEDLPPPYWSSGSTECETETPRWGDLDEEERHGLRLHGEAPILGPTEATRRRPTGTPWQRTIRTPWRTPTRWTPRRQNYGRGRTPWTGQTRWRPYWRTPWAPRQHSRER